MQPVSKEELWDTIVTSVSDLLDKQGQLPGQITPDSSLSADLGVSSVDTVHLFLVLEDKLQQPLEFEKLAVRDGEYRADLTLGELWEFVASGYEPEGAAGTASA